MVSVIDKILSSSAVDCQSRTYRLHELTARKSLYIYGAGNGFNTFNQFILKKYAVNVVAVIDQIFSEQQEFQGFNAIPPDMLTDTTADLSDAVVVITVGKSEYHREIFSLLRRQGFAEIVLCFDIYEYHLAHCPAWFKTIDKTYWAANSRQIESGYNYLEDDESRQVYQEFLSTFIHKRVQRITSHPESEQYLVDDIDLDYSRLINCGSYDGDTVHAVYSRHGRMKAVACFEPDLENYRKLVDYLSVNDIAEHVSAFPCGVYSRSSTLRFSADQGTNSSLDQHGEQIVQCVALDDALPGFSPTLINMDVEGAEPDALKGAEKLIKSARPGLAICVYHAPFHVWQIIEYLATLNLGYKFYLRNYTSYPAETVLYAKA